MRMNAARPLAICAVLAAALLAGCGASPEEDLQDAVAATSAKTDPDGVIAVAYAACDAGAMGQMMWGITLAGAGATNDEVKQTLPPLRAYCESLR